jgi:hypothetical protein
MRRDCSHNRPRHGRLQNASGCGRAIDILLLLGSPEVGPSKLVRRLATIPPEMPLAEAIETARLPCVAGRTALLTIPAHVTGEMMMLSLSEMRVLCIPSPAPPWMGEAGCIRALSCDTFRFSTLRGSTSSDLCSSHPAAPRGLDLDAPGTPRVSMYGL